MVIPDRIALVPAGSALPAAGEWVTFVEPSGSLSRRDLTRMAAAARGSVDLVVAAPGVGRAREVDLDREPGTLAADRPAFAFRLARLRDRGLDLDPDVDLDLAGPLLAAEYLLREAHPVAAVVPSRRGESAPIDWQAESRYTLVPGRYASLLGCTSAERGAVPGWLQYLALSQLTTYLREDDELFATTASLPQRLTAAFHGGLASVLEHVDDATILGYLADGLTEQMRFALLYGAQGRSGHTRPARLHDSGRHLTRFSYLYAGQAPRENITVDGVAVPVEHQKHRSVEIVGRALISERILWAPERAALDVDPIGVAPSLTVPPPGRIARYRRVVRENSGIARRIAADVRIRLRARRTTTRERYRNAWLLMDRDTAANDNAEHLYRYLRTGEPGVNAWFILARDSPDWDRLQREGFGLIAFGSDEYFAALLNCAHLVSSQIDDYVVKPFRKHVLGRPRWRFTFLQHGVIMHDLSRWLNRKSLDLLVTSTPDEHRSIVADATPYRFTDLETRMVGLARHDRLLQVAEGAERTSLLVMPTWRRELLGAQELGNQRQLLADFWESDYARAWRDLLESDRLRALCEREGWQLTFMPHPTMTDYLDSSPLPRHVATHRFGSGDIQAELAGAAAFVTDYSSMAMEAGYLGRPVVYYQFDRDAFYSGRLYQLGDWSYERQGFGPITLTATDAIDALDMIARDGGADPEYAARMQRAFPLRDGRCCERTVAAIRAIARN